MMVNAGDVIENPVTGERITFVRTSEQTGGALAELDLELSPAAFLAAEHIHRSQVEKFQVLEGRIVLRCRGEESMRGPGETVIVPAGAPHAWAPHGGAAARVRIIFTPGEGIEQFFDEFFRLAREGRVNSKGMPSLPISARLGLAHDMYLAGPPVAPATCRLPGVGHDRQTAPPLRFLRKLAPNNTPSRLRDGVASH